MDDNPGDAGISRQPLVRLKFVSDILRFFLYIQKGIKESLRQGFFCCLFIFSSEVL